jgi:hypothetical protein
MMTIADGYTWTDKAAFAAASILAAALLIGAVQALRFKFSRRPADPTAGGDPDGTLVYPQESPLIILPFLAFNGLVVFLALYVPWPPLWLRILVALPFLFMGAACCIIGYLVLIDWFRHRGSGSSAPKE